MDNFPLIRLHLNLECVDIDENGCLVRIPGPDPDTIHRVYVTRHAQGDTYYFREGLSQSLRCCLHKIPVSTYFEIPEQVQAVLAEEAACDEIHIGKSYVFPDSLGPQDFPDVVRVSQLDRDLVVHYDPGLVDLGLEVFAVLSDGEIVSTCQSSRENGSAGEAWVRTLEGYRRRGFARQVTAAWGYWLLRQGKVPFYSHRQENLTSQAVAHSLGLLLYMEDAGYA